MPARNVRGSSRQRRSGGRWQVPSEPQQAGQPHPQVGGCCRAAGSLQVGAEELRLINVSKKREDLKKRPKFVVGDSLLGY